MSDNVNKCDCLPCKAGILARFDPQKIKPLGKQTVLIEKFMIAAKKINLPMAVFYPENLLQENCSPGYLFDKNGWKKHTFEIPEVIYDRFYSSITNIDPITQKIKKRLEIEKKMVFLNSLKMAEVVTDKIVFHSFMKTQNINSPEILMKNIDTAENLWGQVTKSNQIILKPRFGRMGKCIIRLNKKTNDKSTTVKTGNSVWIADNCWHMYGIINQICSSYKLAPSDLIVQNEIILPGKSKRFFDIRILVQRTSIENQPIIAGEVARISSENIQVPNIDYGGMAYPLDNWLEILTGKSYQKTLLSIRREALNVFDKLESKSGLLGEAGIDLLLDQKLNIWTIEVNSKPGRIAFERLASGFGLTSDKRKYFANQRKNSILNPVLYLKNLLKN